MKTLGIVTAALVMLLFGRIASAGYATCPGCTFHVPASGGTMTLNGTPTTSVTTPGMYYTAVVHTDQNQSYQIYPVFGQPLNNMPVPNMAAGTTQAWITWTLTIPAIGTRTSVTPLTPQ